MPSSVTAASFSQRSLQMRQSAEMPQPSVGNLRAAEVQFFESIKSTKMLQSRVTHRGVAKPEPLQLRQASKMHKPRVGDSRANQLQCLKLCQSSKMFQSSIRDRGFVEQEPLQLGQSPEVR